MPKMHRTLVEELTSQEIIEDMMINNPTNDEFITNLARTEHILFVMNEMAKEGKGTSAYKHNFMEV